MAPSAKQLIFGVFILPPACGRISAFSLSYMRLLSLSTGLLTFTLSIVTLTAHAEPEPFGGCVLAAANQREVLRAQGYLHHAIPARILLLRSPDGGLGHAALVYRLEPEGWYVYDDMFGSRSLGGLRASDRQGSAFPAALVAARAAFPSWQIARAWYTDTTPQPVHQ